MKIVGSMAMGWFSSPGKHRRNGEEFLREGKMCEAVEEFSNAIELEPRNAETYLDRGASYRELGRIENAIADFDKAIDLDSEYAFAYTVRGSSLYIVGERRKALADYERAIRLDPGDRLAYYCRGVLFMALKDYERALEDFNKALEPNPKDILASRARFHRFPRSRSNKEPDPLEFDETIAIKHDESDAYFNRGYTFAERYRYEEAIADYDMSIELNPENADAYLYRGRAYFTLKNSVRAFEDYDKVIDLNPDPTTTAVAFLMRSLLYCEFMEYENAAADIEKAAELGVASEDIQSVRQHLLMRRARG